MVDLGTPSGTDDASLTAADLSCKVAGSAGTESGDVGSGISWSQGTGFVDLGNLGGPSIIPKGINAVGQVTGVAETSSEDLRAFLWDPRGAGPKDLGTLGGGWSSGEAISASGQVVGYSNPPGVESFRQMRRSTPSLGRNRQE
jgi:probable HAF family extracellular repeat protein